MSNTFQKTLFLLDGNRESLRHDCNFISNTNHFIIKAVNLTVNVFKLSHRRQSISYMSMRLI